MTRLQRLRAARIEAGLCRGCGEEPAGRYRNCRRCREKVAAIKQAVRAANAAAREATTT